MRFPEVKLLFGWGVCSSPQLSPIQWLFFPERRPEHPHAPHPHWVPPHPTPPHNMWKNECEALSLTDTEPLSRAAPLVALGGDSPSNTRISTQYLFTQWAPNEKQQERDKMETKSDKWTNGGGGGILFCSQDVCGGFKELSSRLEELYTISPMT